VTECKSLGGGRGSSGDGDAAAAVEVKEILSHHSGDAFGGRGMAETAQSVAST